MILAATHKSFHLSLALNDILSFLYQIEPKKSRQNSKDIQSQRTFNTATQLQPAGPFLSGPVSSKKKRNKYHTCYKFLSRDKKLTNQIHTN